MVDTIIYLIRSTKVIKTCFHTASVGTVKTTRQEVSEEKLIDTHTIDVEKYDINTSQ